MTSAELRETYLKFFEARGHRRVPSDSLLPSNDPTLLFTSAGMVQFKPYYVAKEKPFATATSSQRCFRTNDIDQVGMTGRHLTFFEMLGNFSFGDYFKEGAIAYAWEFLTQVLKLDPKLLYMSVYDGDDDAEAIWRKLVPDVRIVKFGNEDNYWPAGSVLDTWAGPNGPCSEIYYDFGAKFCADPAHPCDRPGVHECDRWIEIWNLVFPQFMRSTATGENPPMAKPGIDTGMGLERVLTALQDRDSLFETDLFEPRARGAAALMKQKEASPVAVRARRIVADHVRASAFLVSDGVLPSNEGRGYVLRRLIRRAVRQTALFGEAFPVVSSLVPAVVKVMSPAYPELAERERVIADTILAEEKRFIETLHHGLHELEKERSASSGRPLTGTRAFYLYDTFGFPKELTEDIWVREMKLALSPKFEAEYKGALEEQQERARAAWKGSGARALGDLYHALSQECPLTVFTGYEALSGPAKVLAIVKLGGEGGREGVRAAAAEAGETVDVVLNTTPLYAEAGGQVADRGKLVWEGGEGEVADVQKPLGSVVVHTVRVTKGRLAEGAQVRAEVDAARRLATARHHTATHLVHAALRSHVGKSATQAGSLVAPDRLRFDFMSQKAVDPGILRLIEETVNARVLESRPVETAVLTLKEAKERGAMMLFGEKYGDKVRLVEIPEVSRELCAGTHVSSTSVIGPFVITDESAVASGVRRIEALAGGPAIEALRAQRDAVERAAALLRCPPRDLEARVGKMVEEHRELEQALATARRDKAAKGLSAKMGDAALIGGVTVLMAEAEAENPAALRELADRALDGLKEGIVLLGARGEGKCHLIVRVSAGLANRVGAAEVVRAAAAAVGGSGGGKPEMAQAGGREPEKMPEAFARAREFLETKLARS